MVSRPESFPFDLQLDDFRALLTFNTVSLGMFSPCDQIRWIDTSVKSGSIDSSFNQGQASEI